MFSLRSAAARFQEDLFYSWDSVNEVFNTGSSGQIIGRLFRIDRFTTIYHRPTRRRQITFPPGTALPASGVVKHASTGEIFILSDTVRADAVKNVVYDRIVSAHLAMPPSGGLGSLRRPTIEGTGDDPGAAVLNEVRQVYFDSELRAASAQPDTEDVSIGHYFLTFSVAAGVMDDDWLVFGSEYYKIVERYPESGFMSARAIKESYTLLPITYYRSTGAGGGYNPTTGEFTPTVRDARQISALISKTESSMWAGGIGESETRKLYIDVNHITWDPTVDDVIDVSGHKYLVTGVTVGKNQLQWELNVVQWTGSGLG